MPRQKILWLKDEYLRQIVSGRKTVEIRVGYANILRLEPGDTLLLNNRYHYKVSAVRRYANFEEMVATEDSTRIAPELPNRAALLAACRAIYPPEKEALGVVALEIKPEAEP